MAKKPNIKFVTTNIFFHEFNTTNLFYNFFIPIQTLIIHKIAKFSLKGSKFLRRIWQC